MRISWRTSVRKAERDSKVNLPISLIIPFRNESHQLQPLITELSKFLEAEVEILLVDDQSQDGSFGLAKRLTKELLNIRVIQSTGSGKKEALAFGITNARGELILTSDADCRFPKNWIEEMTRPFRDETIQMVSGPVQVVGKKNLLTDFQRLDWASISLVNQVSNLSKNPLMCSGANLAFRKSAFENVGGYQGNLQYLSGDDEFLLKKVIQEYGWESFNMLIGKETLVFTQAENSWSELIQQRARWASKWGLHGIGFHAIASLLPFFFQLIWVGSFLLLQFRSWGFLVFLGIWILKILAEKLALGKVLSSFEIHVRWRSFVYTCLIHPCYVIRVGFESFNSKIQWKGRNIKREIIVDSYGDE